MGVHHTGEPDAPDGAVQIGAGHRNLDQRNQCIGPDDELPGAAVHTRDR